jgi:hypothetical protein
MVITSDVLLGYGILGCTVPNRMMIVNCKFGKMWMESVMT